MWTSIASNVISAAVNHLAQPKPVQHNQELVRCGSNGTQPSCGNCRNSSSDNIGNGKNRPDNTGNRKSQQGNSSRKQNGDNNKFCQIVIPQKGNYEITVKKFESNSAKMNVSRSNSTQSNQKDDFKNISRQNSNKLNQGSGNHKQSSSNQNKQYDNQNKSNVNQNKQNGNQNRPNVNQNKQNGNQNRPNVNQNKPNGNQNKPNGNYNGQNGNQNKPNGNQIRSNGNQNTLAKTQGDQNHKPGDSKFVNNNFYITYINGDNNSGSQNKGANVHNERGKPGSNGQHRQGSVNLNGQSTWMYLGRLKVDTTEYELKNYLHQKFPGYQFTVVTLPLYKDAKLPCFKVHVDNRILDEFQNLEHWPEGVKIIKFIENFKVKV